MMRPTIRLVLGFLVCIVIAVGAYFWATGIIDSLYSFRSPLKDQPPPGTAPIGHPATRRVVLVLVDALRYDTSTNTTVMPVLAGLRQKGASATMHSLTPSYSEPGYSCLLTGAWPYLSDGPAMNLAYADIPTWTQDNLFSSASRAGLKTAVSGYYWFEKLIPQETVSAHFYTPGEDAKADQEVMQAVLPWLDDPQGYQLILVHIDQVDYAGHHEGGPRSPNWNTAANRADAMIGQILAKLDLTRDTIAVFSDHGQIDRGGHGGYEQVVLTEPFVIAGAGVKSGHYPDIQMVDVAPTISALLGLGVPASAQGFAQTNMLSLTEEVSTGELPSSIDQKEKLATAYIAAIGGQVPQPAPTTAAGWELALEKARSVRVSSERVPRGILAILFLGLSAWGLMRLWRGRNWLVWIAVLVYLAAYHLRYAVIDGFTYSFSSIMGPTELVLYNAVTGFLAMLAAWLVYMLGGRNFSGTRREASFSALGLTFRIAFVLSLFVLVNFVINGREVTWTTPEPVSFFFGVLALIQLLFVGVYGLLLAGVSPLIAWIAGSSSRHVQATNL